jgi:hypothetical protein
VVVAPLLYRTRGWERGRGQRKAVVAAPIDLHVLGGATSVKSLRHGKSAAHVVTIPLVLAPTKADETSTLLPPFCTTHESFSRSSRLHLMC